MKRLFVFLLLISIFTYSKGNDFNFNEHKAYKITISNLSSSEQALYLARLTEKNLLSEFSWIDYSTGIGYFIVKKENNSVEIEKLISKTYNLTVVNSKEIILDDNFFLEMYMQKGGIKSECALNQPPNYIYLGLGNDNKAEMLYQKAKLIWVNKYPEYYNAFYNNNVNGINDKGNRDVLPKHYPVYINTGNPEYDSSIFDKSKREWIEKYPEEYSKMSGTALPSKIEKSNEN